MPAESASAQQPQSVGTASAGGKASSGATPPHGGSGAGRGALVDKSEGGRSRGRGRGRGRGHGKASDRKDSKQPPAQGHAQAGKASDEDQSCKKYNAEASQVTTMGEKNDFHKGHPPEQLQPSSLRTPLGSAPPGVGPRTPQSESTSETVGLESNHALTAQLKSLLHINGAPDGGAGLHPQRLAAELEHSRGQLSPASLPGYPTGALQASAAVAVHHPTARVAADKASAASCPPPGLGVPITAAAERMERPAGPAPPEQLRSAAAIGISVAAPALRGGDSESGCIATPTSEAPMTPSAVEASAPDAASRGLQLQWRPVQQGSARRSRRAQPPAATPLEPAAPLEKATTRQPAVLTAAAATQQPAHHAHLEGAGGEVLLPPSQFAATQSQQPHSSDPLLPLQESPVPPHTQSHSAHEHERQQRRRKQKPQTQQQSAAQPPRSEPMSELPRHPPLSPQQPAEAVQPAPTPLPLELQQILAQAQQPEQGKHEHQQRVPLVSAHTHPMPPGMDGTVCAADLRAPTRSPEPSQSTSLRMWNPVASEWQPCKPSQPVEDLPSAFETLRAQVLRGASGRWGDETEMPMPKPTPTPTPESAPASTPPGISIPEWRADSQRQQTREQSQPHPQQRQERYPSHKARNQQPPQRPASELEPSRDGDRAQELQQQRPSQPPFPHGQEPVLPLQQQQQPSTPMEQPKPKPQNQQRQTKPPRQRPQHQHQPRSAHASHEQKQWRDERDAPHAPHPEQHPSSARAANTHARDSSHHAEDSSSELRLPGQGKPSARPARPAAQSGQLPSKQGARAPRKEPAVKALKDRAHGGATPAAEIEVGDAAEAQHTDVNAAEGAVMPEPVAAAEEAAAVEAAAVAAAAVEQAAEAKAAAEREAAEEAARAREAAEEAARAREAAEEAARARAKARAEAEAEAAARQAAIKKKMAKAGTAFAALLMDDNEDDDSDDDVQGESDEDSAAGSSVQPSVQPVVSNGHPSKNASAGPRRKNHTSPAARRAGGGVDDRGQLSICTTQQEPKAEAVVEPELPAVWWGSEEHDEVQRRALTITSAVYSKKGEHKLHANEDRYTMIQDLNSELEKKLNKPIGRPEGSVPPANSYFAVFDGHGGSECAAHAASRLHLLLPRDENLWREDPRKALELAFSHVEGELREAYETSHDKSGTCALTVLLRGHRLFIAGLGDCRGLLLRADQQTPWKQLTTDQRATEPSEQHRIAKAGGTVTEGRVWGALIPSRTLGDFPWKDKGSALSSEPEILEYEVLPEDKYLVLGSDGLFDVLSNKTISRLIGNKTSSAQKACNELVKELKKKPSNDDVTMIVVQLGES